MKNNEQIEDILKELNDRCFYKEHEQPTPFDYEQRTAILWCMGRQESEIREMLAWVGRMRPPISLGWREALKWFLDEGGLVHEGD